MKKAVLFLLPVICCLFFVAIRPVRAETSPLDECGGTGIYTAIGCIDISNQNVLITKVLTFAIGIGGGVAFLLMLLAGFMIMTSQGDPKRLQAGQELLSSAIMGLIMLIFSVFILKLIGVDILNVPGFSTERQFGH